MQPNDSEIADDLALISHTHSQIQVKTTSVAADSASLDPNVHNGKSKILKYNTENANTITVDGGFWNNKFTCTVLGGIIQLAYTEQVTMRSQIELSHGHPNSFGRFLSGSTDKN
ncbi:unnamed protein product [Schistosoma margrebowiei]|uniref:Uncharacterized protein n=1 Tax=Schistosoma margrebowiei TaxID=48269 RepID=A0A183M6H7_9TREM|nr:unnamed protein product [Schistosoma margrebowiei]